MRYHALACDYDGTLALHGSVDDVTLRSLVRLRESGRRLILVTGRQVDDLLDVFPRAELFDRVVAENGALLYRPDTHEEKTLAQRPPHEFVSALRARRVDPLSVGRVIVATWEPRELVVLEVIRELGLELQVVFNKGAVMVLPSGVNKATGLRTALEELGLSPHNVAAIGDAENDHAFLSLCECSVAVANALPVIKEYADLVTQADHGAGVTELTDRMVASDLRELEPRLARHEILLGTGADGREVRLRPYGVSVLLTGLSGSGKSTFATSFLERLSERGYQFCVVDPEGDYQSLAGCVVLGDRGTAPAVEEVLELLERPGENVVVNLLGMAREHRPDFFERLLPALLELRSRSGRPHWIVVDETHHLLPAAWAPARSILPAELSGMMFITVHPDHVARAALVSVDAVIAVGASPEVPIHAFAGAVGEPPPPVPAVPVQAGEAVGWWRRSESDPFWFRGIPPGTERRRHVRKYATGDVGPKSFYFRGPQAKLNLRAQNLMMFVQLAEGVDDATWVHHLRRRDYSRWFREAIKDEGLASAVEAIEQGSGISPQESRERVRAEIEQRYTEPA